MKNKPTVVITHTAVSLKEHTHMDVGLWHFHRWNGYRPSTIRTDIARYAGYHYIINWDGSVEQCRHEWEEGIHCKGMNFSSIGVCFMGNGDMHLPSTEQMLSWLRLYQDIRQRYRNIPTRPHRAYAPKTCHGAKLNDTYFEDGHIRLTLIQRLKQMVALLRSRLEKEKLKG